MNSLMATVANILCKLTWKQPSWIWGESFQFEIHSKLAAGYQMALFLGRNIKSQLRNYKMADEWGTRKTMKISLYFLNDPPLNATQTFRLINRSGGGRLFYANELLSSAKRKSFFFSKLEQRLWAHSAIGKKRKSFSFIINPSITKENPQMNCKQIIRLYFKICRAFQRPNPF